MAQRPRVGQGLLVIEASRSQSHTPQSAGLLWTNDQPDAETSPDNTQHSQETSMPPAGIEPAIPASERPQTHALDRAATGSQLILVTFNSLLTLWALQFLPRPIALT